MKLKFFKKIFCVIIIICILSSLSGCALKKALPLNDVVRNLLIQSNVEKSKITELADDNNNDFVDIYDSTSYKTTDQELQKYVDDLLLSHKTDSEAYTSSDQYILDYYGVETEEEFLALCKIRLNQIKRYENKHSADNEFLDKIAQECKFYINKKEAVKYSEKHNISYDEGIKEIKRYLLVGAYTNDRNFDTEHYAEFCSMNGYDSTQKDNTQAKYDYLKDRTISEYGHLMVEGVLYNIGFDNKTSYTVNVYDSSNIYTIDFSKNNGYTLDKETQDEITTRVAYAGFGGTMYGNGNHLYQTVLVFKDEGKVFAKVMVDEINGFVKWQQNDGQMVCAELKENLRELIERAKQR